MTKLLLLLSDRELFQDAAAGLVWGSVLYPGRRDGGSQSTEKQRALPHG